MKKLIVGGTFDVLGGRQSYLVAQLASGLGPDWECINGGYIDTIRQFTPTGCDVLLWMPNVSNDELKIIDTLKTINPRMILIQSKRVIEKDYLPADVVGRLLKAHALLGIMITKHDDVYMFDVIDPLGNIWASTSSIVCVGRAINDRLDYLLSLSRVGSIKTDLDACHTVPEDFVSVVREYGTEFAKFIKAFNPNRLLGNASTRCAKGFPAVRMDDHILVTRRNVDKETLSADDFVLVDNHMQKAVHYAGDKKPSVDTPIQVKLFEYYPNVKYMIHGHAYVHGGLFTSTKVPCGYVEEVEEVTSLFPDSQHTNFVVNLKGHGCLILGDSLEFMREQMPKLYGRPLPEA